MRRRLLLLSLLTAIVPTGVARAQDGGSPDIVGGSATTSITDAPYQVALVSGSGPDTAVFCGGSILDASHVITAAHCVSDQFGNVDPVSSLDVVAGTDDLATPESTRERSDVSAIEIHPDYAGDNDVALLTLTTPLTLGPSKEAVTLATTTPSVGSVATVTGWGTINPIAPGGDNTDPVQSKLREVDVNVLADNDASCSGAYGFDLDPDTMVCAAASGKDSCQGDSGGPLVSGGFLIGIVSFGDGCAASGFAGVYTEVAAPVIYEFLTGVLPQAAPSQPPSLTGTPKVGETLTCNHGQWSNSPTFTYAFFANPASPVMLTTFGTGETYSLTQANANQVIGCIVKATSSGGAARTEVSNSVGPIAGTSTPQPTVTQTITVPPPPPPVDATAPIATVTGRSCTITTCRVDVTVDDPGYSTGVQGITLTYVTRYRVACKKRGKKTTCARTRRGSGTPVALGANTFAVRLRNLPAASSTVVSVLAIDKAGNKQVLANQAVLRTKPKPKKRKK